MMCTKLHKQLDLLEERLLEKLDQYLVQRQITSCVDPDGWKTVWLYIRGFSTSFPLCLFIHYFL